MRSVIHGCDKDSVNKLQRIKSLQFHLGEGITKPLAVVKGLEGKTPWNPNLSGYRKMAEADYADNKLHQPNEV